MHSLPSLQTHDPNYLWRRSEKRNVHAARRATGRSRGPRGQAVCRARRPIARSRTRDEAGIKRDEVYVTNTVKHFKWEPRGKRRIHQKPNTREIAACRPWLEVELRLVRPKLLVCLGATAAQAIFGPSFRVTRERGKTLKSELAPRVLATVHPSSLLRQPDEESREREYARFVADLRAALKAAAGRSEGECEFRRTRSA